MIKRDVKRKVDNWIKDGKSAFLLTGARQIGNNVKLKIM